MGASFSLLHYWVKARNSLASRSSWVYCLLISGRPEDYVDRDRGISVNIGPQDIRTSMLKQRMFLSKTHVFMQEEQQGHKVFVEQAAHEMHKCAYDRALNYLDRAIRVGGN